ncbi:MAG TPA: SipW-dependent-type signal peptide-containing protein [Dehalococcoidia bacterium]|nr:SipW-dependent-type signal peptide-containing protein [Dehalococcoidia bacterium]
MKRSILLSVLVIGAVAALVGAGSWATFSDTETSADNIVSTGSLNLKIGTTTGGFANCNYTDPWTGPLFSLTNAAPGDWHEVTICVKNDGTMAGTFDADATVTESETGCNEPEEAVDPDGTGCGTTGELGSALTIDIWVDADCDNTNDDTTLDGNPGTDSDNWFFSGNAAALDAYDFGPATIAGGQGWCYGVKATVNASAGNEAQTDKVEADMTFTLTQAP